MSTESGKNAARQYKAMGEEIEKMEEGRAGGEEIKRKVSVSYTIKQMKQMTEKLKESKMITEEEYNELCAMHRKIVERWIGYELK